MGEYADLEFEDSFNQHLDDLNDLQDGNYDGDGNEFIKADKKGRKSTKGKYETHEYTEILKETAKAYLFKMTGGATHWIPKRFCSLNVKDKMFTIPSWLREKIDDEDIVKAIKEEGEQYTWVNIKITEDGKEITKCGECPFFQYFKEDDEYFCCPIKPKYGHTVARAEDSFGVNCHLEDRYKVIEKGRTKRNL